MTSSAERAAEGASTGGKTAERSPWIRTLMGATGAAVGQQGAVHQLPSAEEVLASLETDTLPDAVSEAVASGRRRPAHWQGYLVRILLALDTFAALVGVVVGLVVAQVTGDSLNLGVAALFPAAFVLITSSTRAYEPRFLGTGSQEYRRVGNAGVRLLALASVLSIALQLETSRLYVLAVIPTAIGLSLFQRYVARQLLRRQRALGNCLHRIVVVGRERACAELVRQLRREPYSGFAVVGACIDTARSRVVEGVPVIGNSGTIVDAVRRVGADTVAVGAWSDLSQEDLRRLSWQLEGTGIDLVVAPSLSDVTDTRLHIRPVAGLPLLHVSEPEFSGGRRLLKSAFDRSVAGVALLLLSPVLLALALAVRFTSAGPSFFRQTRVGVDGRTFRMVKLRSMYVDAEDRLEELREHNELADGLLFKMREDPRVTPLGRVLRRFSLDELPQLWNILKGEMSIVGPRPPLPSEVELYADDVQRRLLVPPGLTGLWQVSGRSDLSWEESVRLDLHYVENWSLALDLMIVWKTAYAVLAKRGAY